MNKLTQQQLVLADFYFQAGQARLCEDLLLQIIGRDATVPKAYELLAYLCGRRGDLARCETLLLQAAALPTCSAEALFYLGKVQLQRGRGRAAVASLQRSISMAGEFFEGLHELGVAYSGLSEHALALQAFQRAQRKNPRSHEVLANIGNVLCELRQFTEALQHYDQALALEPRAVRAWAERGRALTELGRGAEALDSYDRALALAPHDLSTLLNRATTLATLDRADEARAAWEAIAQLPADTDYVRGSWIHDRMLRCRWEGWSELVADTRARVVAGERAAPPFALLAMPTTPAEQLICARTYAQHHCPPQLPAPTFEPRETGRKLRVGYFSTDFRHHATSQLMVRLFECHDRSRFEWFGFALGPVVRDDMSARVEAALDHFIVVSDQSDEQIAATARATGIDIAVDLNGFIEGAQPGIFAHRAAPIQVNYLGFPGTMGCSFMDYIVADATVIAAPEYAHYAEKVIVLPDSYQVNDNTKQIGADATTREHMGLPSQGFVFACFNNNYKITPDVFAVWMRLLRNVSGSVLWLFKGNGAAPAALSAQALSHGIDPNRIVWAERLPLADHLARHAHADLFLDTFHYNAHTTCSDALWAGLPVLTLAGPTFASRVGASLLGAVGLPELITHKVEAYEALALSLAHAPHALRELRDRLAANRTRAPLFDTPRFARHIEAAFEAIWDRHRQGLPPDHVAVDAGPRAIVST